jgi:hypothetical protein
VIAKALAQLSCSLCTAYVLHGHNDLFHNVEDPLEISHNLLKLIGPSLAVAAKPQQQPIKSLFKREFPLLDLVKLLAGSKVQNPYEPIEHEPGSQKLMIEGELALYDLLSMEEL